MSLLWMDGFDSYGHLHAPVTLWQDAELNKLMLSSGYVSATGVGCYSDTRTGYGQSIWLTGNSGSSLANYQLAFDPKAALITGFAFKYEASVLSKICAFEWDNRLGTVTRQMIVYANAEGGISLSIDGGNTLLAASSPNIIFPGVWQYIEMKYTPNKTVGQIIVKIDGQTCIQYDGPTSPNTTPNQVNMIEFYSTGSDWGNGQAKGTNGLKLYDDLYVLDTLGSGFNTFLGDVVVHSVPIIADQGPNSLSQFGGSAGHFSAVDEWPPNEDESYLYTNTVGDREMFTIGALPDNIIDVLAVSTHVRGKKDAPGQSAVKLVTKYSSYESVSVAKPLAVQYVTKNQFLEQCPDGTGWTKAKAQSVVVGFEVA